MNILFFNNVPFAPCKGGIERITDTLTREFLKLGHNVFYGAQQDWSDMENYKYPAPLFFFPASKLKLKKEEIENYHKFLIDNKIDMVINQKWTSNRCRLSLCIPKEYNIKKMIVIHSNPLDLLSRFSSYLNFKTLKGAVCSLYFFCKKQSLKKRYNFMFNNVDKVCLLSESFREVLQVVHKGDEDKVVCIPNMNSYDAQEIDFTNKKKQILFVGRLSYKEKRADRLIKAWELVYNDNPDWELVIVGEGRERNKLEGYVNKHKIERVHFEGVQKEPQNYFKEASIVCLTSSYEGFGLVLTEGMVHGCVPVSFDSYKAVYDIIDNQKNGVIVPKFNIEKYAKELNKLMNDDELRVKLGEAAQEKAKQFSKENVVKRWVELFNELQNI